MSKGMAKGDKPSSTAVLAVNFEARTVRNIRKFPILGPKGKLQN